MQLNWKKEKVDDSENILYESNDFFDNRERVRGIAGDYNRFNFVALHSRTTGVHFFNNYGDGR